MRRLYPEPGPERLGDVYRDLELGAPGGGAHVALGMVSSVDGAASVEGRTAGLGGAADHLAFTRLREACDVLLVGAGTVRDEDYGPPVGDVTRRRRRSDRGLAEVPTLAVVTGSLELDPASRLFADPRARPLLLTTQQAAQERAAGLGEVAEVVIVGDREVDLGQALAELVGRGLRRVLCEGGPRLNARLLAADLVDELFVTITPVALGGSAPRIAQGPGPGRPRTLELVEVREHGAELLLRYARVVSCVTS